MRCIKSDENTRVKSVLKKYPEVKLRFSNNIKGKVMIKNIRFYSYFNIQVDIVFEGKLNLRVNRQQAKWHDSSLLTTCSKIKLYRIIRKNIFRDLRSYLRFFDVEIHNYYSIKKVNWV